MISSGHRTYSRTTVETIRSDHVAFVSILLTYCSEKDLCGSLRCFFERKENRSIFEVLIGCVEMGEVGESTMLTYIRTPNQHLMNFYPSFTTIFFNTSSPFNFSSRSDNIQKHSPSTIIYNLYSNYHIKPVSPTNLTFKMHFNINTASLIVLFCSAFAAHAAPFPGSAIDLAVRQNANPASNNGGKTGGGAAAGVGFSYLEDPGNN